MKNKTDFTKNIMDRINSDKIKVRPRYQFIIAAVLIIIGILGTIISSAYFFGLSIFAFRARGPLSNIGITRALGDIPWWALVIALLGLGLGYWLWKKSETTYKITPSTAIVTMLIIALTAGIIINSMGWGDAWFKRGLIKKFYRPPLIEEHLQHKGKISPISERIFEHRFWVR